MYTLAAGFFVGMEWLFLTKPSFLNVFTWAGRWGVFGAALLPVVAAGAFVLVVLDAAARIPLSPVQLAVSDRACGRCPSLVLSASALLLVDNFTTTLFGWGIASLRGGRLPYASRCSHVAVAIVWHGVGRWAACGAQWRSGSAASHAVCAVGLAVPRRCRRWLSSS